jgi:sulfite reductase beta subunit-like hemoprotein
MSPHKTTLEQLKSTINPFDAFKQNLTGISRMENSKLPPKEDYLLKWNGLYLQYPAEKELYMLRLKLPNGLIDFNQFKSINEILIYTKNDFLDLTTRQDIQFRNLKLTYLPEIFNILDVAQLTSTGACGDNIRNIVSCPLNTLNRHSAVSHLVRQITYYYLGNYDYARLPRKFKIAISNCENNCTPIEINDIGILIVTENKITKYCIFAGGGLALQPTAASYLGYTDNIDHLLKVIDAIIQIFNKRGNRNNRHKARLKYLIKELGFELFLETVEKQASITLNKTRIFNDKQHIRTDHTGIKRIHNTDKFFITIPVMTGRLNLFQINNLLEVMNNIGSKSLIVTAFQNIIISDIPETKLEIAKEILLKAFPDFETSFWKQRFILCTGKEFCNKAIVETKNIANKLINQLENSNIKTDLQISMSGCHNSCSQNLIADIGLQGTRINDSDGYKYGFNLLAGSNLNYDKTIFAKTVIKNIPSNKIYDTLTELLTDYEYKKPLYNSFSEYIQTEYISQNCRM